MKGSDNTPPPNLARSAWRISRPWPWASQAREKPPDEVRIDTLNVQQGGNTFGYSGIMSRDNHEINVGTINIAGNTLDLSGHAVTLAVNDLKNWGIINDKDLMDKLVEMAGSVDLALANKEALQKIIYALTNNSELSAAFKEFDEDFLGSVQGVTLAGIDGQAVTVNMLVPEGAQRGPQLVLGDIADGTKINVNFDEDALSFNQYQDGENAVLLYGNLKKNEDPESGDSSDEWYAYSKADKDFTLTLNYTQGYNDAEDLQKKLQTLAGKVNNPVTDLAYKDNSDNPYHQHGKSDAKFEDNIKVSVGAYGLYGTAVGDVTYNQAYDPKDPEKGQQYELDPKSIRHLNDNHAAQDLLDPSVYTAMLWRVQMGNLHNRLGDLRLSNAQDGLWARVYGGHHEFDDRDMDGNYYGVQAGFDRKVGSGWTVGAALSYVDGSLDYRDGSSDAYAYDLSLYGTFTGESGAYVDLIGKIGRISNDSSMNLQVGDGKVHVAGDYAAVAYSLSAEFGRKFDVSELMFVEPQVQLSWGHVNGDTVSYGQYSAHYDDIDMLIGRIGVRTGFALPEDMGSVYLRVNALKDFCGDVDGTSYFSDGKVNHSLSTSEDMGDAWYEAGLGTALKFNDAFYIYAECMYADGGDVDSIYGNAGVRFLF